MVPGDADKRTVLWRRRQNDHQVYFGKAYQVGRFREHIGNAKLLRQLSSIFLAAAGDSRNFIVGEEPEYGNVAITAPVADPDDSNANLSAARRIHGCTRLVTEFVWPCEFRQRDRLSARNSGQIVKHVI